MHALGPFPPEGELNPRLCAKGCRRISRLLRQGNCMTTSGTSAHKGFFTTSSSTGRTERQKGKISELVPVPLTLNILSFFRRLRSPASGASALPLMVGAYRERAPGSDRTRQCAALAGGRHTGCRSRGRDEEGLGPCTRGPGLSGERDRAGSSSHSAEPGSPGASVWSTPGMRCPAGRQCPQV